MKELNQVVLRKGLLTLIEQPLRLTKEHLDNPERQVEVESPLSENFDSD